MCPDISVDGDTIQIIKLYYLNFVDVTDVYWSAGEKNFTFDGNTYIPMPISTNSVEKKVDMSVVEVQLNNIPFNSDYIIPSKMLDRYLDNAVLSMYYVDRNDVSNYRLNFKGKSAGVNYSRANVNVSFKSNYNELNKIIPKIAYDVTCPFRIYGEECTLSISANSMTGVVDSGDSDTINDSARAEEDGYFDFGYVQMTSGANNNEKRMVKSYTVGVIELLVPFTNAVSASDTYTVYPHCLRKYDLCDTRFGNKANFGGCPHIPKPEEALL